MFTVNESYVLAKELVKQHARIINNILSIPDGFVRITLKHGFQIGRLGYANALGTFNISTNEVNVYGCDVFLLPESIYVQVSGDRDAFCKYFVETLAHEFRHAWQYYSGWYQREVGWSLVCRERSFEEYYASKEEVDAREFSLDCCEYLLHNDFES